MTVDLQQYKITVGKTDYVPKFNEALDAIQASLRVHFVGDWATSTAYNQYEVVKEAGTSYICLIAHTSGVFATDLAAGKWEEYPTLSVTGVSDSASAPVLHLSDSLSRFSNKLLVAQSDLSAYSHVASSNEIVIGGTTALAKEGITVVSATDGASGIFFSTGTSGDERYAGFVQWSANINTMVLGTKEATGQVTIKDTEFKLNSGMNFGVGVAPETTDTNYNAMYVSGSGMVMGRKTAFGEEGLWLGSNLYFDGTWRHRSTAPANLISVGSAGATVFHNAVSGAADAAVVFTQPFRIEADGEVRVLTNGLSVEGGHIELAAAKYLQKNVDNDFMIVSGGNNASVGANLIMYGSTHATKAQDFVLRSSLGNIIDWDYSALLTTLAHGVLINQDNDNYALDIDSEAATSAIIRFNAPQSTTAYGLDITNANSLTTGGVARLVANGSNTGAFKVVNIQQQHASATGATALYVSNMSTGLALSVANGTSRLVGNVAIGSAAVASDITLKVQGASTDKVLQVYNSVGSTLFRSGTADLSITGGHTSSDALMYVNKDTTTEISIAVAGTVDIPGADYAEYETLANAVSHGDIAKGDVIGFDVDGKVTNDITQAVSFGIKSTKPNIVGGSGWGSAEKLLELHDIEKPEKPEILAQEEDETEEEYQQRLTDNNGIAHPIYTGSEWPAKVKKKFKKPEPEYIEPVRLEEETDEVYLGRVQDAMDEFDAAHEAWTIEKDEHPAKRAQYLADVATYEQDGLDFANEVKALRDQIDVDYEAALVPWKATLETERQKVDRISYVGKVPVNNVTGDLSIGNYVYAEADGTTIKPVAYSFVTEAEIDAANDVNDLKELLKRMRKERDRVGRIKNIDSETSRPILLVAMG
jgi:hypothetical protein